MHKLNPEHIKAVIDLCNQGPYFRLLSMEVRELGIGYCKVEVNLENKHLNPFGGVHGGVYSSLIDTAAYWAVYCDVEENAGLISLDINVNYLAPIKEGRFVVEGKRIKAGRSILYSRGGNYRHSRQTSGSRYIKADGDSRTSNNRPGSIGDGV